MKEGFSQVPEEQIGDKKEEQKKSAKTEMPDFVRELKEKEKPKNWLKEKYDEWRHK